MLSTLKKISTGKTAWRLLFISALAFELCALFFQHFMKLEPCVMCIYERVAMWGVAIAALIGMMAPKVSVIRWLGLLAWLATSIKGTTLAWQHVQYQLHPSPFFTCDVFVQFPQWAPLNKWIPWMFEAYGDCSDIVWTFLTLSMPQWLVVVFSANVLFAVIFLISQFKSRK
ncbi:disulfide bond formation protein DsbB [Vibrio viridaestus]|uniref:Disulfide bond formation protein B n=1 Tax=Vibrio viridaestus TaxID=2487322 RepID=A0A3N9TG53_9VIBR|nr:disulfide bond formation protein DsbB [Vibrio viridaestus]RQW63238.1 disulfide bond formation protein DsbB [Vibrio viridaestus]